MDFREYRLEELSIIVSPVDLVDKFDDFENV